jgi:hypothetical protein
MPEISCLAEKLLASQEGLCCKELIKAMGTMETLGTSVVSIDDCTVSSENVPQLLLLDANGVKSACGQSSASVVKRVHSGIC